MSAKIPIEYMNETCQQCGAEYKSLGQHWANSNICTWPKLPTQVKDVMKSLINTRGFVDGGSKNSSIRFYHGSMQPLREINNFLGIFSGSLSTQPIGTKHPNWEGKYMDERKLAMTKTHPEIGQIDSWEIENAELGLKILTMLRGGVDVGGPNSRYYAVQTRKQRHLEVWEELFHKARIEYSINRNKMELRTKFENVSDIELPVGWWNSEYMS